MESDYECIASALGVKLKAVHFEEGISNTIKNVLSKKELQVEDPEFDAWCDKVISVLEKAKKEF